MIYDCFIFYNELDLLEIRLNELNDVVDKFVLVEAAFTHQNEPKSLIFELNKDRFAKFSDKIIHIKLDEPPRLDLHPELGFSVEIHHRNSIVLGIDTIRPEDWIIISDADEIPRSDIVLKIARLMDNKIAVLLQRPFSYFIDYQTFKIKDAVFYKYLFLSLFKIFKYKIKAFQYDWWLGSVMVQKKNFTSAQLAREVWKPWNVASNISKIKFVKEAGWHFTYLGGVEKIISKLQAFSHSELNTKEINNETNITKVILSGKSISGDKQVHKEIPVLPLTHPKYVVENIGLFTNLLFRTFARNCENIIK